ncbi:DUF6344 domain-containing protein [Streptomyces sp. NPDC051909]|uniref:DUF6344 domain-containing protein n=1 Tax=Streptomyces sp. NPDC051909 TaxID=3154944 RepID=UPI003413FF81
MATAKVKQFWTAFVSVLVALFASLGLATPATAATAHPALAQGDEPAPAGAAEARAERAAVPLPAQRTAAHWHLAQGRALPPTIKQRIGAEAHGSSPAVRHLPVDGDAADGHGAGYGAAYGAGSGSAELSGLALTGRTA